MRVSMEVGYSKRQWAWLAGSSAYALGTAVVHENYPLAPLWAQLVFVPLCILGAVFVLCGLYAAFD